MEKIEKTNHYRPSRPTDGSTVASIIKSDREMSPFVDLSFAPLHTLHHNHRLASTGPTRWANLLIGLAVDGMLERGEDPQALHTAFACGELTLSAELPFVKGDEPAGQGYQGSLVVEGRALIVRGGDMTDNQPTKVIFSRTDAGAYVPVEAVYSRMTPDGAPALDRVSLPVPFKLPEDASSRPAELMAAEDLGDLEMQVTRNPEAFSIHTSVRIAA